MKIAVVLAVNPDGNTGMLTVDNAASAFFSGRGLDIQWLLAGPEESHKPRVADYPGLKSMFDDPDYPDSYERIIFWGDFLQSHVLHARLASDLVRHGRAKDASAAKYLLRKYLLLSTYPDHVLGRVAIIGSSIHPDGRGLISNPDHLEALRRLLQLARCVRLREPLSAYLATLIAQRDATVGMDAAFFAIRDHCWKHDSEMLRLSGPVRLAVISGRGSRSDRWKLRLAAIATRRAFGKRGVKAYMEHIPWLSIRDKRMPFINSYTGEESPSAYLQRLQSADGLITTVYHAAVNAWSLGIPVVLLGRGAEHDFTTIQSKKKELLALSFFAADNYLFLEDISVAGAMKVGERCRDLLIDDVANKSAFNNRKIFANWLYGKLEEEIALPSQRH